MRRRTPSFSSSGTGRRSRATTDQARGFVASAIRLAMDSLQRGECDRSLNGRSNLAVVDTVDEVDILRAIQNLAPKQRAAIVLFYFEDRPVAGSRTCLAVPNRRLACTSIAGEASGRASRGEVSEDVFDDRVRDALTRASQPVDPDVQRELATVRRRAPARQDHRAHVDARAGRNARRRDRHPRSAHHRRDEGHANDRRPELSRWTRVVLLPSWAHGRSTNRARTSFAR